MFCAPAKLKGNFFFFHKKYSFGKKMQKDKKKCINSLMEGKSFKNHIPFEWRCTIARARALEQTLILYIKKNNNNNNRKWIQDSRDSIFCCWNHYGKGARGQTLLCLLVMAWVFCLVQAKDKSILLHKLLTAPGFPQRMSCIENKLLAPLWAQMTN